MRGGVVDTPRGLRYGGNLSEFAIARSLDEQSILPTIGHIDLNQHALRFCHAMTTNQSITFFDTQFQKQIAGSDFALNPFEKIALPFVRGHVLDLGCGMGNLSVEAARRGANVLAIDASAAAIERVRKTAFAENLAIDAVLADIGAYEITGQFDTIVAIGLLMFFKREKALVLLADIQEHVVKQGIAIINVLTEGTTFMGMFEPNKYYLFGRRELEEQFKEWKILCSVYESFDAPGNTKKEFSTVIAQKN